MTQPLSAVLATSSAVSLLASGGSTPAAAAVLGYLFAHAGVKPTQADLALALVHPFGYPGDSRADGNPAATVLSAHGLAESDNALEENDER